ncbi:MAG: hypothetical protein M1358_22835 [Chloroflexi bacterium]|nr:hypothetical protein [Chloroflexota bacterium]
MTAFKVVSLRSEERFNRVGATIPPGLEIIHCAETDEEAVAEACKDADVILGMTANITARVTQRAAKLKFIQQGTAGYETVVRGKRRGIAAAGDEQTEPLSQGHVQYPWRLRGRCRVGRASATAERGSLGR